MLLFSLFLLRQQKIEKQLKAGRNFFKKGIRDEPALIPAIFF